MSRTYTPRLTRTQERRALRRAYSRSRQSHPDFTTCALCALVVPALIAALVLSAYVAHADRAHAHLACYGVTAEGAFKSGADCYPRAR